MYYYAHGIKYDTDGQEVPGLHTDMVIKADFLRELANAIENSEDEIRDYETYRGVAKIEWPE